MKRRSRHLPWLAVFLGMSPLAGGEPPIQLPDETAAMVIRLVHPDRQAAEVLRLFEGCRAAHPAAALTIWKQAHPGPSPLGKPLEALIALANPEMVQEWRALHEAELRLDLDPADGSPRWYALIPRDDGTMACVLTAMRLTYPEEPPLEKTGAEIAVARLDRSGAPVACQLGPALLLGSSRSDLVLGVQEHRRTPHLAPGGRAADHSLDAGITFCLTPGRIPTPHGGSLGLRRAVEALHGIGCRRIEGSVALRGADLRVETKTVFDPPRAHHPPGRPPAAVDPAWLEGIPSSGVMAVIVLAIDPQPASWDRAFALADRVERVDPARAGLAPLRTRLNLLAAATGVQPEADLWPHLRGVSVCLLTDPATPRRPAGTLVMLHLDEQAQAARLVQEFAPRLARLRPDGAAGKDPGRGLSAWRRDRSVLLAWGDHQPLEALQAKVESRHSLAAICCTWDGQGRGAPQRLGAFWPGRLWRIAAGPDATPAALRTLADDPPALWWGWNDAIGAQDCLRWPGLSQRVRQFLETIPLDASRSGF